MLAKLQKLTIALLGIALCIYTLGAVNYNVLQPQSALTIFMMLGMVLCFLVYPAASWLRYPDFERTPENEAEFNRRVQLYSVDRVVGVVLAVASVIAFGYIFIQTEPTFKSLWPEGSSLGDRASNETTLDVVIGVIGLVLVLEATRRSIGWIVPALALAFMAHAYFAPNLPDVLLPHQGQNVKQLVSSTFLQSLGVLGPAAGVMFKYVFLFVVFGALLEMSGATRFIIDFANRLFGRFRGGSALVSVFGAGMMGSLSGSAVANAMTTGSFTIPMMRNSGFKPEAAGGITAAAASGGALVPPVMGAGAYMMLEFIERPAGEPQVTFLEIARAAVIPSLLYYFSLLAIVFLYSRKAGATDAAEAVPTKNKISSFEGMLFFGALALLVFLLVIGFSPFRAVSGSLVFILLLSVFQPRLNLGTGLRMAAIAIFAVLLLAHQASAFFVESAPLWLKPFLAAQWVFPEDAHGMERLSRILESNVLESILSSAIFAMFGLIVLGLAHPKWRPEMVKAFTRSAKNGISLVAASACVGIIIGIVQTTPMANEFSEAIKGVVETNLLLALIGIMVCSLVLGMGVPSVVCYLLMATLMGSLLSEMGVEPLAAHLFIFYYGMMSMVTPPVALAAYASASIAEAKIIPTSWAAFRFSLIGFTLPFMFIYRPALLLMNDEGRALLGENVVGDERLYALWLLTLAVVWSVLGILSLAAGVTGQWRSGLSWLERFLYCLAAVLMLAPNLGGRFYGFFVNLAGAVIFVVLIGINMLATPSAEAVDAEHVKPGSAPSPKPSTAEEA
ncbi:MAG: TRAP transporter fused permease subunit [Pirellulaceae bacterium]